MCDAIVPHVQPAKVAAGGAQGPGETLKLVAFQVEILYERKYAYEVDGDISPRADTPEDDSPQAGEAAKIAHLQLLAFGSLFWEFSEALPRKI